MRDNARNYRKGRLFKPIAALQGQGLLTSEGALWLRQRRLAQPAFHRRQIATFAEVIVDCVFHGFLSPSPAEGWLLATLCDVLRLSRNPSYVKARLSKSIKIAVFS